MQAMRSGKAYADALYALASPDEGLVGEIDSSLQVLAAALADNPDWHRQQHDPLFASQRAGLAAELLAKAKLPPLLERFLLILARRAALGALGALAEAFAARCQAEKGIIHVEALTAQPVEQQQKDALDALAQQVFGKGAVLSWHSRPDLLAGFVLRSPTRRLDVSLAGKLRRLANKLALPATNMAANN